MKTDRHGYAQCDRCKTLRPAVALVKVAPEGATDEAVRCVDEAFCSRAAGVGKGELTGDGEPR